MQAHAAEHRHLDLQLALARPIFLVLALVDLLEAGPAQFERGAILFLATYLALAVLLVLLVSSHRWSEAQLPVWAELAALAVFLVLTPSVAAFWFVYLFVAFAAAIRWGIERTVLLAGLVTLALLMRTVIREPLFGQRMVSWVALVAGTFAAGVGIGFLGVRGQRAAAEHEFLTRLSGLLQVEQGLAESVRQVLDELARTFTCEEALLAFQDQELDRIFVWKVRQGQSGRITPDNLPVLKSDAYLLDDLDATVCWNSLQGPGEGFGWNRQDGKRLGELPRLPGTSRQALHLRSLLAATLEFGGQPVGRILLGNGRRKFTPHDLRWLERIVRHLGPLLENLFLLRHLRARAIEAERSRISRDLHDGILQTLLSLEIQLDVLRRKLPHAPDQVAADLGTLEQTLRKESEELRRLVTDLRPLRVQSADLVDLMRGVAERFRNESGLALDLFVDSIDLRIPDRVCRELFQIYREALHNIKKHARATHVVVKLGQDETKVSLMVDDNGQGFSFAGHFTSDELDRLRLGPISIKERARSVGGTLTVESNPGHGARLTVEVPLG